MFLRSDGERRARGFNFDDWVYFSLALLSLENCSASVLVATPVRAPGSLGLVQRMDTVYVLGQRLHLDSPVDPVKPS